jgi:diguanylate cyclase (GGDEF)-like protein
VLLIGSVLGISRLLVPGSTIMLLCNVCVIGGLITIVQAIRTFTGLVTLPKSAVAVFVCVLTPPFCYWLYWRENFGMRVAVISAGMSLLCLDAAVSMIRRASRADRLIFWPTGFAFAFSACYLAARTFAAATGMYGPDLLAPVPMELAATICGDIAYVGCVFGMLLASNSQLRREAEKMALYDPLTNLPNRRLLLDRLLIAEQDALASGRRVGVIYLDLDGFKLINDTLGHEAGDDLLRNVSTAMSSVLRTGDCLARIGGDEFVVLVEGVENREHLALLADRLKRAVERESVPGDDLLKMRASCGVAVFPEDGTTGRDVMREADAAMYHAKRRSRVEGQTAAV